MRSKPSLVSTDFSNQEERKSPSGHLGRLLRPCHRCDWGKSVVFQVWRGEWGRREEGERRKGGGDMGLKNRVSICWD